MAIYFSGDVPQKFVSARMEARRNRGGVGDAGYTNQRPKSQLPNGMKNGGVTGKCTLKLAGNFIGDKKSQLRPLTSKVVGLMHFLRAAGAR